MFLLINSFTFPALPDQPPTFRSAFVIVLSGNIIIDSVFIASVHAGLAHAGTGHHAGIDCNKYETGRHQPKHIHTKFWNKAQ